MTVDEIRADGWRIFECISGSRAYGTDTPESDTDLKGVFVQPRTRLYGFGGSGQVNDGDDITFYEIGRFVELLGKNNPNLLEVLFTEDGSIIFRDPLMEILRPEAFLSKLCADTFACYAMAQVGKAHGLKKKIVNPMPEGRQRPVDFCYVLDGQGSVGLMDWLAARSMSRDGCGLVKVPHARDLFALFYGEESYRGVFKDDESGEVRCSSVAMEALPIAWMSFNRDAYKRHCREHAAYWSWVRERNEARYNATVAHGKHYDSKNMLHTFRLLDMAEEIATTGTLAVRSRNLDFLMRIRRGEFEYRDLVAMAEERAVRIAEAFAVADLPDRPDEGELESMLVELRERFYRKKEGR